MFKSKVWVYVCLLVLVVVGSVGCATTKYVYQQPYQGALTYVNINIICDNGWTSRGTVVLNEDVILIGVFKDVRDRNIRELSMGATYRIMLIDEGLGYNTYTIEKIKDKPDKPTE